MGLIFRAIIVSFTTPTVVELYVCIGVKVQGQPISISVWRIDTSLFSVVKGAPRSASAAEDMTNLMTR